ncbi:hypothetical protein AKO1_002181 [Acrasis kona]|uniref:Uncharacterized protein n=1 Tax=Acrasis kona TaxID=1008807 RepID=A0AAW2Z917_9EUKA
MFGVEEFEGLPIMTPKKVEAPPRTSNTQHQPPYIQMEPRIEFLIRSSTTERWQSLMNQGTMIEKNNGPFDKRYLVKILSNHLFAVSITNLSNQAERFEVEVDGKAAQNKKGERNNGYYIRPNSRKIIEGYTRGHTLFPFKLGIASVSQGESSTDQQPNLQNIGIIKIKVQHAIEKKRNADTKSFFSSHVSTDDVQSNITLARESQSKQYGVVAVASNPKNCKHKTSTTIYSVDANSPPRMITITYRDSLGIIAEVRDPQWQGIDTNTILDHNPTLLAAANPIVQTPAPPKRKRPEIEVVEID